MEAEIPAQSSLAPMSSSSLEVIHSSSYSSLSSSSESNSTIDYEEAPLIDAYLDLNPPIVDMNMSMDESGWILWDIDI